MKVDLDTEKEKKEKAQKDLSALRRKTGVESKSVEVLEVPASPKEPIAVIKSGIDTTQGATSAAGTGTEADEHGHGHHQVNWFPRYCPDGRCGTLTEAENKGFKDEVACAANGGKGCGMHLGALKDIKTPDNPEGTIVRCPNCGGQDIRLLSKKPAEGSKLFG